jgi:hypothetical protein
MAGFLGLGASCRASILNDGYYQWTRSGVAAFFASTRRQSGAFYDVKQQAVV